MENVKTCTKCGRELSLDQFYESRPDCKVCRRAMSAIWRLNNPDRVREGNARWRKGNPAAGKEAKIRWRKDNPEKARAAIARWRQNNPGCDSNYQKKRRAYDLEYMIMKRIRCAMYRALNGNDKADHTIELLGCSIEYLRHHLENQFTHGMSWDNYGRYGWHIDHIIPLSYFDHSDSEQQRRAWHYTNLQPLWARDNLRKSNKIEERQLVLL